MIIRRRMRNRLSGRFRTATEGAEPVERNARACWVRLQDGNVIKRRIRDMVEDE